MQFLNTIDLHTAFFNSYSHVTHFFIQSLFYIFVINFVDEINTDVVPHLCSLTSKPSVTSYPLLPHLLLSTPQMLSIKEPWASSGVTSPIGVRVRNNSQIFLGQ